MKDTNSEHNMIPSTGWGIAEAKQNLSKLLKASKRSPQVIYHRDEPVAVVLLYAKFVELEKLAQSVNLLNLFEHAREITRSSSYTLEIPNRVNRVEDNS